MIFKFPKMSNDAEYHYLSGTIHLADIESSHIEMLNSKGLDIDNVKSFNTIAHEITHYLDHISTLKGRELMIDSIEALHTISNIEIEELWRVIALNGRVKKIFHEDYYKVIEEEFRNKELEGLTMSTSTGLRFNNKGLIDEQSEAILFTRYAKDGHPVARIPIALESIWEGNAIATEVEIFSNELSKASQIKEPFEIEMYKREFVKGLTDYLFNSERLVYSNATQYVSKYMVQGGDIFLSFHLMKVLSGIVSNLPNRYYKEVNIPHSIKNFLDAKRLSSLLINYDAGLLFLCLVFNFYEKFDGTNYELHEIGEVILSYSGLPSSDTLSSEVIKCMNEQRENEFVNRDGDFSFYAHMLDQGKTIFRARTLFNYNNYYLISLSNIGEYPIITADDCESHEHIRWENVIDKESKIKEFVSACSY